MVTTPGDSVLALLSGLACRQDPAPRRAAALELTLAAWQWRARTVRWPAPGAACADGWALDGLSATGPDGTLAAEHALVCADGAGEVAALTLDGPLFTVSAASATWTEADGLPHVRATAARFTRCRCADPPWEVHADALTLDDAETVGATWPTLRLGGVPVMAAPAWEFPLEARRAGVLPPELAWRGDDGPAARLPIFLPVGRSADLTPAPGYEMGAGPTGAARLRWRTDPRRAGRLGVGGDAHTAA
jgi:LPS-assembly protein